MSEWVLVKCNCGASTCDRHTVENSKFEGNFYQGSGWPRNQAQLICDMLNAARAPYGLTFNQLREANSARLPQFKNKHGEFAHAKQDGSDWSRSDWLEAAVGELGEYANISKKHRRGDISKAEFLREAADELADVVTYLDILATQLGINLGDAVASKFNRVSERVGSSVFISGLGVVKDSFEVPKEGPK